MAKKLAVRRAIAAVEIPSPELWALNQIDRILRTLKDKLRKEEFSSRIIFDIYGYPEEAIAAAVTYLEGLNFEVMRPLTRPHDRPFLSISARDQETVEICRLRSIIGESLGGPLSAHGENACGYWINIQGFSSAAVKSVQTSLIRKGWSVRLVKTNGRNTNLVIERKTAREAAI